MDVGSQELSVGYILSDISKLIADSLPVRREATRARGDYAPGPNDPITKPELKAFVAEFVSRYPFIGDAVLHKPQSHIIELPPGLYDSFLNHILGDAGHRNWLGADGPHYVAVKNPLPNIHRQKSQELKVSNTANPHFEKGLRIHAPSLTVILSLFRQKVDLDRMKWRDLELIIGELLESEGYRIQVGSGSKDGGADIIAEKTIPTVGFVRTVWQAKHFTNGSKVGLSIVRELADVKNELKATKAFIVTSSYLTKGALQRVQRDEFGLGKVERPELEAWINGTLSGSQR